MKGEQNRGRCEKRNGDNIGTYIFNNGVYKQHENPRYKRSDYGILLKIFHKPLEESGGRGPLRQAGRRRGGGG